MTRQSGILPRPEGVFYLGWAVIFGAAITWIAWRGGELDLSAWQAPFESVPTVALNAPAVETVMAVHAPTFPTFTADAPPRELAATPPVELKKKAPPKAQPALMFNAPVRSAQEEAEPAQSLAPADGAGLAIPIHQPKVAAREPEAEPQDSTEVAAPATLAIETSEPTTIDPETTASEEPSKALAELPEVIREIPATEEADTLTAEHSQNAPQHRVTDIAPESIPLLEGALGTWEDLVVNLPQLIENHVPRMLKVDPATWKLPETPGPLPQEATEPQRSESDLPEEPAVSPAPSISPPRIVVTDQEEAPPEPAAPPAVAKTDRDWPEMPALELLLARLHEHAQTTDWAMQIEELLVDLREQGPLGTPEASAGLHALEVRLADGPRIAETLGYDWSHTDLMQTHFALKRRIAVWRAIHVALLAGVDPANSSANPEETLARLSDVEEVLREGGQLLSWGDYLRLSELRAAAASPQPEQGMPKIAQEVLLRFDAPEFNASQRRLLTGPEFNRLTAELQAWVSPPMTVAAILQHLENYEEDLTPDDASRLARLTHYLRHHHDPLLARLGSTIDHTYRNANFRLFIHADLLQVMLPDMEPDERPINDTILGARVFGRSRSQSRLSARPVPDEKQWRVQLEVNGVVDSSTSSESGPVTVFNRGRSRYTAVKQVAVGPQGFFVSRAEARASTTTDLADLQTDYDGIPLIGSLVRNVARGQTDAKKSQAEYEVQNRVKSQAQRQLETELNEKVEFWQEKLFGALVDPLQGLGLDPSVVEMRTTTAGLSGRFRAADQLQLSAHTPRPSAPAGSLLSVQFHETTINNLIEKLRLHGRSFTPEQFIAEAGKLFPAVKADPEEPLPENVEIVFAQEAPVSVRFEDGRVKLTLRMREFTHGNQTWTDLEVSAFYSPDQMTKDAKLSRDSTVFLTGHRLGFRDQLALRAVFLKVLSKQHAFSLLPEQIAADPRIARFPMNQLAIHEGWFAFALGDDAAPGGPRSNRWTEENPILDRIRR
ncbi:MAG: hypothetical protein WD045_05065 [Pirellulaceae bacterium]